ncbi:MAG: response regulator transcription factor [Rubrivivax sp.]
MNRHLALVEDNETILANYADFLEEAGFRVDRYGAKDEALHGLLTDMPELLLLDIELHNERDAGYDICLELRRRNPLLPLIFISSHGSDVDKISGMRVGADDYITKPVSLEYLLVRIEALLRRVEVLAGARLQASAVAVSATELAVDEAASTVRWQQRQVDLTLTQFWIVRALHGGKGQVVSAEDLMKAARLVVERNTVAAHIKAIREAFLRIDAGFDRIRTERSRGYRWLPVSPSPAAD